VNALVFVTSPVGPATTTLTAPAACAGVEATIDVAVFDVIEASVPPKRTEVVLRRPVPLIVTAVPPPANPELGETDVTVAGAENVNAEVAVTEPPAVVMTTLTAVALADLAGVVTTTDVSVRLTIV
jgi:hypothetical protein